MKKLLASLAASAALIGGGLALAPTAAHASTVLLGNSSIQTHNDSVGYDSSFGGNDTEAFGYTAGASGTAHDIQVYLTTTDGAEVGLYSDVSGKPSSLLDSAELTTNSTGWVTFTLGGSVSISNGTQYWISVAPTNMAGETICQVCTVGFRDTASGSNKDWLDRADDTPATYSPDVQFTNNPMSAFVETS